MRIVISKEIKNFMRCAKQITEIEGRETGFLLYYFDLPENNHNDQYDIFHTDMVIGDKQCLYMRSKYKNFLNGLEGKVIMCGSFHTHPYRKYLDSHEGSKVADKNRLTCIKEYCRNCLSFGDLETVLTCIAKRDPKSRITCVLSDIEENVSYYVPKKYVSVDTFASVYDRFKKDRQSTASKTVCERDGLITFPTSEYRKMYSYIFDLFDENTFDLNFGETIIDI